LSRLSVPVAGAVAVAVALLACGAPGGSVAVREAAPTSAAAAETTATPVTPTATVEPAQRAARTSSTPVVTYDVVRVTQKTAFKTKTVMDSALAKGATKVTTRGVAGVQRLTYRVTMVNGRETGRELVERVIVTHPITRVRRVGTKVETEPATTEPVRTEECDPNYAGACVPIASDVDCAGGNGNGPAYVRGPVTVVGSDIYGLDRDNDGTGCD
jgi:hypothetical protein